jgi:hypothetical protein
MRLSGHVARITAIRNVCKILVDLEEKISFGRSENNIKMDLNVIVCEDVDWIHLNKETFQWRAFVNTAMNPRVA